MAVHEAPLQALVDELGRLPGVGPKSAARIAYHLLRVPSEDVRRLAAAIVDAKERMTSCQRCFNLAQGELCRVCTDERRDATLLCVVEEPRDVVAIERTSEYRGRYHVLQGAISPVQGIGPEQLRIRELLRRVREEGVAEVILATNPNLEGEVTADYVRRELDAIEVRVTRIARGLPAGGDLEYADEVTLGRAIEGRRELS